MDVITVYMYETIANGIFMKTPEGLKMLKALCNNNLICVIYMNLKGNYSYVVHSTIL
ncbi:hypothetical protein HanIR_Chr04g0185341 [Helianthus annuus]|nr:hypothetical protein HanIR_Chr04g0185341 [Helianthus annuus]